MLPHSDCSSRAQAHTRPDPGGATLAAASWALGHTLSQQRRGEEIDAVAERPGGVYERRAQVLYYSYHC